MFELSTEKKIAIYIISSNGLLVTETTVKKVKNIPGASPVSKTLRNSRCLN